MSTLHAPNSSRPAHLHFDLIRLSARTLCSYTLEGNSATKGPREQTAGDHSGRTFSARFESVCPCSLETIESDNSYVTRILSHWLLNVSMINTPAMNNFWPHRPLVCRWVTVALVCSLGLQLGAVPALAQGDSSLSPEQKQKLQKELQQTYKEGANLVTKIEGSLVESLKGAASAALNGEDYETALSYYEELTNYTDNDPSVYYNRGLALINMNRTEAGLESLQTAIEIGNQTGNTRVAGLATERIQDEFVATASEALQGDNPSQSQIETALDALDQMREYVDPSATSMFYRATALFEAGQHQQAIQNAREGLEMHQGSRSDAAKFHYIIGESQLETGNKASACETFENAAYGDYQARANHYLENECDNL
ncbi:MAG: hypothetical protein BRD31_04960 [Bacteroidetes bacterium QH_2_64_26]|nr:MAG: hypothetical protein BRD31_04960 [Bacteroidetes bacterium QH_2_64_26]